MKILLTILVVSAFLIIVNLVLSKSIKQDESIPINEKKTTLNFLDGLYAIHYGCVWICGLIALLILIWK